MFTFSGTFKKDLHDTKNGIKSTHSPHVELLEEQNLSYGIMKFGKFANRILPYHNTFHLRVAIKNRAINLFHN